MNVEFLLETSISGRDCAQEVMDLADQYCTGNWTAPAVALEVVQHLRLVDPDLLDGFLQQCAVGIIRDMLSQRARVGRTQNRRAVKAQKFKEATDAFERSNDAKHLETVFLGEIYTLADGRKTPLWTMRADDLRYVAGRLRKQSKSLAMRASFLNAIAERCGGRMVEEVYTEGELAAMWGSLSR